MVQISTFAYFERIFEFYLSKYETILLGTLDSFPLHIRSYELFGHTLTLSSTTLKNVR